VLISRGLICAAIVFSAAVSGQNSRKSNGPDLAVWKPGTCERPSHPWDPPPEMLRPPTLAELHEVLRTTKEPHDAYLEVTSLGNEATVPLLLDRLRLDYGEKEPTPPPGRQFGFICTQGHLIEALRTITNTDQGMFYPRWAAWWAANQKFDRKRWALDGFAAAGLHVSDPVDERFGLELIDVLGHGYSYSATNAARVLSATDAASRAEWVVEAAASPERIRRLGALAVLDRIDRAAREEIVRKLTADSDLEIRRQALSVLDERERARLASVSATGVFCRAFSQERFSTTVADFAGDLLIVAHDDEVKAFDPQTRREIWKTQTSQSAEKILVVGERIVLATRDGDLLGLDIRGKVLWHRTEKGGRNDEISGLILSGSNVVTVRSRKLEVLDPISGNKQAEVPAFKYITSAASSGASTFFVDGDRLRSLTNEPQPEIRIPNLRAVSVTPAAICVSASAFNEAGRVRCLKADTLDELWSYPIRSQAAAPVQDGSRVYVATDNDLSALNANDGSLLWTTASSQAAFGNVVPTVEGLLLANDNSQLELRDPQTGQVRRVWPRVSYFQHISAHDRFAVVTDPDGIVWLIDLAGEALPQ